MDSITPRPDWNVSLDNFEESGEFTVEMKSEGIKVHCNNHKNGYKLTALHSTDGVIEEKKVEDKSNVQDELDDLTKYIEDTHL